MLLNLPAVPAQEPLHVPHARSVLVRIPGRVQPPVVPAPLVQRPLQPTQRRPPPPPAAAAPPTPQTASASPATPATASTPGTPPSPAAASGRGSHPLGGTARKTARRSAAPSTPRPS